MAANFTFTDSTKVIIEAWGKFQVTLEEAVVAGDLLSHYETDNAYTMEFADQGGSQPAQAIAMEDGAAHAEIWACLAAVVETKDTVGTGGVVTPVYFAAEADFLGLPLYLGAEGKMYEDEGGTYKQLVGYLLSRKRILLVPNTALIGVAGSFTSLAASAAFTSTLTTESTTPTTGANKFTGGVGIAKRLNVGGGIAVTTLKPVIQGLLSLPKLLATAKTSSSGAWSISVAELLGGFIVDATHTGGSTPTLPTVAAVVAQLVGWIPGTTFRLIFKNTGNQIATLTTDGAQWTMDGIMTIAALDTKEFLCRIENGTAGTVYTVSSSTTDT